MDSLTFQNINAYRNTALFQPAPPQDSDGSLSLFMQLFDMSCVQYQNGGGNNGGRWTDFIDVEAALSQSYHLMQFLR